MRTVMLATPAYLGTVTIDYVVGLAAAIKLGVEHDIDFVPVFLPGEALIQRARNELLAVAVDANVSDIIWIDADQGFRPEWLLQLLDPSVDVLGGAVVKKSDQEQYNVKATAQAFEFKSPQGYYHVDSVGTGFLRLSRKAFMYLWDSATGYTENGVARKMVFEVRVQNGSLVGEDVVLCQKLTEGGFTINLDPRMTCSHTGNKTWAGNFEQWLTRVKGN